RPRGHPRRLPRRQETTAVRSAHAARNVAIIFLQPFAGSYRACRGWARWSSASVVITCRGFNLILSITHNRARRNSDAGLAIVAQRSWMKREHCVAIYIFRNCLFRRRLAFHQLLVIVENHFYEFANELVR